MIMRRSNMQTLVDVRLVTSDEFVTGLLSELKLK